MSLIFNGIEMDTIIFNGVNMDTVIIDGVEVFTAKLSHFYNYQYNPQWNAKVNHSSSFSNNPLWSQCIPGGSNSISFTFKKTSKLKSINVVCDLDATASPHLANCLVRGNLSLSCNGQSSSQTGVGGVVWHEDGVEEAPWSWSGTLSINVSGFTNGQTYTGYISHSCSHEAGNPHEGAAASGCKVYSIMPVYG